ncbi:MAG TPA: hypothetical protein VFG92_03835 [Agromyces sp.]|nr:hypothetical protein [Agromyces sp.]
MQVFLGKFGRVDDRQGIGGIPLDTELPALAHAESLDGERLTLRFADSAQASTFFDSLGNNVAVYLEREKRSGRVREDILRTIPRSSRGPGMWAIAAVTVLSRECGELVNS